MFTAFTTQLVSDEITFLLIAETDVHATALSHALTRQGVKVEVALYDDVKANTPTWQAQKAREYYKLVWLVSDRATQKELSQLLVTFLSDRFEPTIVVFHVTHPLAPDQDRARPLQEQSRQQVALVERVQEQLPAANVLLATDVVDSHQVSESFFNFMHSDPDRQAWFDPAVKLAPQRDEDVTAFLVKHLLKPHTTVPYLIKGKDVSSGSFLKKVQHVYGLLYGKELPIKHEPIAIGGEWTFTSVTNPHAAPMEVLVDLVARSAPEPTFAESVVPVLETPSELPVPELPSFAKPSAPIVKKSPLSVRNAASPSPSSATVATTPPPLTPVRMPAPPLPLARVQMTPPPSAVLNPKKVVIPRQVPPRIENRMFAQLAAHYTQVSVSSASFRLPSSTPSLSTQPPRTIQPVREPEGLATLRARVKKTPPQKAVQPLATPPSPAEFDAELEKELAKLFSVQRVEHKVQRVQDLTQDRKTFFQKIKRKKVLFATSVLGLGISLGLLSFYLTFVMSYHLLKNQFVNQVVAMSVPETPAMTARSSLPQTLAFVKTQLGTYQSLFSSTLFVDETALTTAVSHFLTFSTEYRQAEDLGAQAVLAMIDKQEGDSMSLLSDAVGAAQRAYEALSQYQSSLRDFDEATLSESQRQALAAFNAESGDTKKVLVAAQQLNPLLPTLLGVQQKRTYALLFQNNQELRPTGGYVQAVALITFDKGKLIDSQVFSTAEIDAKQAGAVVPPEDIQRLLGEQRWYFRDINWDPDFPTTARNVNAFLERSIGKPVDGVIGLNLYTIQDLLKTLGPLELPEYNEIITDRNLPERVEFHSEIQLVPNERQSDYSAVLLTRLLHKMTTISDSRANDLMTAWYRALESKQLQVAMINSQENLSFNTLGWTGGLMSPQCPAQLSTSPCFVDGVAQFEANIGINKANYHVTRSISQKVTIEPNVIRHHRTIVFSNSARSNAWPQGPYKAFTRLYLPLTARLGSVSINGSPLPAGEVTTKQANDKLVIGFSSETPIQTQTTIEVEYTLPHSQTLPFSYTFFNQQQPGVIDGLSDLVIEFDPRFKPSKIAPQGDLVGSRVSFKPDQNDHVFVGIEFK